MSLKAVPLNGGTNSLQTTSEEMSRLLSWYFIEGVPPTGSIGAGTPVTGDFAVQAQSSPNKTVKVKAGKLVMRVTPTSGTERLVLVTLSADHNVTIADNTTGSTRYDKIYVYLDPDTLDNPPANGDFTEALTIKTQRDSSAGVALTDTNTFLIAEVTVANGFTTITDANITEKRTYSTVDGKVLTDATITTAKLDAEKKKGWDAIASTLTYQSATTASGSGLLNYIEKGDKVKLNQSIPLTSYWPLIANSTDTKSGYNGTDTDITYTAGGKFGNAATFNGTSSKIVISDQANLKPTGAFTIEMSAKLPTKANKTIFQSWNFVTSKGYGIRLDWTSNGYLSFLTGSDSTIINYVNTATDISGSSLHHIVVSYQLNHVKIFVDGVLQASGYSPAPIYHATNNIRIGNGCDGTTEQNYLPNTSQIGAFTFINGYAADINYAQARYALVSDPGAANITAKYYGHVTALTNTLLTFTGGVDYALYNTTITSPYYSHGNPVGFPAGVTVAANQILSMNGRIATIFGWTAKQGANNATIDTTTVTFGQTFATRPIVTISYAGQKTTAPANVGDVTGGSDSPIFVRPQNASTATFLQILYSSSGNINGNYHVTTWHAIGTI